MQKPGLGAKCPLNAPGLGVKVRRRVPWVNSFAPSLPDWECVEAGFKQAGLESGVRRNRETGMGIAAKSIERAEAR